MNENNLSHKIFNAHSVKDKNGIKIIYINYIHQLLL